MIPSMPTGLDRFSAHPAPRLLVVIGWFVITTMAFFSRYDRFTPTLAAMMAGFVVLLAGLGVTWALLPMMSKRRRRGA